MKICSMTDIGVRREMNQDYFYSSEEPVGQLENLFLVADGMGGHKAGEFASRYAVETIVETIQNSEKTDEIAILTEAITKANHLLKEYAQDKKYELKKKYKKGGIKRVLGLNKEDSDKIAKLLDDCTNFYRFDRNYD